MVRVVDNYTFTPTLVNTISLGYTWNPWLQGPQNPVNPTAYGFNVSSNSFPVMGYGGAVNGISYPQTSIGWNVYFNYYGTHFQDTVAWQKGRHSLKFGGTFIAQGMNSGLGRSELQFQFKPDTGGPIDPALTPWVGSGLANMMQGNVDSASVSTTEYAYPRQKSFALFAVDNFRATSKLTLNLGVRWDVTLPGHEQAGRWMNFDPNLQNPLWGNYKGAWDFEVDSSNTFEKNIDYGQFGPHVGFAYQLTPKLVARASYGLFFVPLGALSSGVGPWFPANQTGLNFPTSNVINTKGEGQTMFNWDGGYPGAFVFSPHDQTATQLSIYYSNPFYINPNMLDLGHTQNLYGGVQYEIAKNLVLDTRYVGNKGGNLHDDGRSMYRNFADWSAYQPVLASGNIYNQVNSPATAATAGVPYPYAGFNGPAWAALSPFPQAASQYTNVFTFGDPATNDVSNFNAFTTEVKARNTHGLSADFSYTLSRWTGNQIGMSNFANNWTYPAQNLSDIMHSKNWIQPLDQTHLAKGYILYDLPFGQNRQWLHSSPVVNNIVGGWTIGYYGSYGSGTPMSAVGSPISLPGFYCCARANFANGANGSNIGNHFSGRLNLNNLQAASNNDFNPNDFASTAATLTTAPFGNTPYLYDHWRWNPGMASESMSLIKHFTFGEDGRFSASLRGEFFNVFNRHYYRAPNMSIGSPTFGQVTGVYGNRVGQVSARVEW
jgi:hypothetical protein